MKLYRFSNRSDSDTAKQVQEFGLTSVFLHEYEVIKSTRCGSWIMYRDGKKWINHTLNKQFAYQTADEAKFGFICRKNRQIKILTAQLREAKDSLVAIVHSPTKPYSGYFHFDE